MANIIIVNYLLIGLFVTFALFLRFKDLWKTSTFVTIINTIILTLGWLPILLFVVYATFRRVLNE